MKFSIIVPAYNEENNIKKSIQSILNQHYDNFEVLVIDDGSTDLTFDIIKQIKNPRLKIYKQKNKGVAGARNLGLEHATGDYIIFVDADDSISSNLLKDLEMVMREDETKLFRFFKSYIRTDKKYKKKWMYPIKNEPISKSNIIYSLINKETINSPWGKVYESDIIRKQNIRFDEDLKIGEDLLFNLDYINYCEKIIFNDVGYYTYENHADSLTSRFSEENYNAILLMHKKIHFRNYYDNTMIQKSIRNIKLKNELSYLNYCSSDKQKFITQLSILKGKNYKETKNIWLRLLMKLTVGTNEKTSLFIHQQIRKLR